MNGYCRWCRVWQQSGLHVGRWDSWTCADCCKASGKPCDGCAQGAKVNRHRIGK